MKLLAYLVQFGEGFARVYLDLVNFKTGGGSVLFKSFDFRGMISKRTFNDGCGLITTTQPDKAASCRSKKTTLTISRVSETSADIIFDEFGKVSRACPQSQLPTDRMAPAQDKKCDQPNFLPIASANPWTLIPKGGNVHSDAPDVACDQ